MKVLWSHSIYLEVVYIQGSPHARRLSPAHMLREGVNEGVVGSRRRLRDIITAVSSCRGCKGQRQYQVVEKLTPHMLREEGWTVFVNSAVMARSK